jgi:hypothetical protein
MMRTASMSDEPSQIDQAMAQARPPESPAIVLARARVESALFGDAPGITRFHMLERLGQGGMGVVYAAYDPDLDRGVALKMIHVPAQRRDLALAEAKALARLSHPNVVPVFDVGIIEDRVAAAGNFNGARVEHWDHNNGDNQRFILSPGGESTAAADVVLGMVRVRPVEEVPSGVRDVRRGADVRGIAARRRREPAAGG